MVQCRIKFAFFDIRLGRLCTYTKGLRLKIAGNFDFRQFQIPRFLSLSAIYIKIRYALYIAHTDVGHVFFVYQIRPCTLGIAER